MPYILETDVEAAIKKALTAGDLNCAISYAIADFLKASGINYKNCNAIISVLEQVANDFRTTIVTPVYGFPFNAPARELNITIGGALYVQLTHITQEYLYPHGATSQNVEDVIGAIDCAKLEFCRRILWPYEDTKFGDGSDSGGRCDPYKDLVI
jgi:hypothetical protein